MLFERFTERARRVIAKAKECSKELKHGYMGTEHILLGILREDGQSKELLAKYGVTEDRALEFVKKYIGVGDREYSMGDVPITPRSKRLLEASLLEAKSLGHNYVTPEHMLLALLKDSEGVGFTILARLFKGNVKTLIELVSDDITKNGASQPIIPEKVEKKSTRDRKSDTPGLDMYGVDLTTQAEDGKLDPVIGRDEETQRVLEILCRRIKNNPCLIGEPGVGKTAIAEGLAQRIAEGHIPEILRDKRVISLDLTSMVAGSKYRGEFEDRLKKVISEIKQVKDVILFIDEIHTIVGAGGAEGAIDASNILKPALARGEIQCIGATTIDEYRKYIEKDTALERRFQPVNVGEPSREDTLLILKGIRDKYEAHHRVQITDDALEAAVNLSFRYITDRFMPDKAIDLIDEAAAKVRINSLTTPADLKEVETALETITKEKEDAINIQDFEKAAQLRDNEKQLKEELEQKKNSWISESSIHVQVVDDEDIANVVSKWTKIPLEKLNETESERLLNLEEKLASKVVGQEDGIKALAQAVRRARVGLKDPRRPIGSFVFLGPTGVGKSELCKALAEVMFGDESSLIRIDMSEYMEKHGVSRLIGAPPGYVGYDEGGQLTEKVRRNPYSVILLDEVEKAHPEIFNVLLQILEDGRLTDGKGKTIDFKNTIIIMTSNVGASNLKKQKTMGFTTAERKNDAEYEKMRDNMMEELKNTFKPEFLNRIDDIIVFHQLEENHLVKIVDLMLKNTKDVLREHEIYLHFSDDAKKLLVKKGTELSYGARPLRRVITRNIEDKLSEEMLKGIVKKGSSVDVIVEDEEIRFIPKA